MRQALLLLGGLLAAALIAAILWAHTPDRPRAELEARHAAPPSRFQEVAGLRLHLRDSGPRDAPAVILLHGFGSSLHTWEDWARGLEDAFRVIRLDLPGFGLTGPDPTGDYSDARGVAVLVALMQALGIPRASLVGSSMGGRIAWTFAATRPGLVERLVLLAPDGFAGPGRAYGEAPRLPLPARLLPWTLPLPLLRPAMAAAYADPAALTEEVARRYHDLLLAPGNRRAILARLEQNILLDPVPLLARIAAPTLLVWGEEDRMVPPANAADYLAALPDARLLRFPGLGHVPMEEAPARTLGPVRAFLRGEEPALPEGAI